MAFFKNSNFETGTNKKISFLDFSNPTSKYLDSRNFSKKTENTFTDSRSFSSQSSSNFAPVDSRSLSLVLYSPNSAITTKKTLTSANNPNFSNSPKTSIIPSFKTSSSAKNLLQDLNPTNFKTYILYALIGYTGYIIIKKTPVGKKLFGGL